MAVVGASNDPLKMSGRPLDYLKRFGFRGPVYPINPTRTEVQGIPAIARIAGIPGPVDLAMIVLPAEAVPDAIRECAAIGIDTAIVAASGFSETGTDLGRLTEQRLRAAIRESEMTVLGPNCLGMISTRDRVTATFTSALDDLDELRYGPTAFVSQSGAFGSFIFNAGTRHGIGWSHYIATGNELELSTGEILTALAHSDDVQILLTYLEGVSNGSELISAFTTARELDKPIIAVKSGRSLVGARAAATHTASLSGSDQIFDGVVRELGVVRVNGVEEMLDAAKIFGTGARPAGRRVTSFSISGGCGVVMADAVAELGLTMAEWEDEWSERLAAIEPRPASVHNPVDLGAQMYLNPPMLEAGMRIALEHPGTDHIAVLLGCGESVADALIESITRVHADADKLIIVVWTGGSGRSQQILDERGIPCFSDPHRAAAALARLCDYSQWRSAPPPTRPDGIDQVGVAAIIDKAVARGRTQLSEWESSQIISMYGIPTAAARKAKNAEDAASAAAAFDGPFAIKLVSHQLVHKSDIGAVELNVAADEVQDSARRVLALGEEHGLSDVAVLLQPMVHGDVELIVGFTNDPSFGPSVVVGSGGVLVESVQDSCAALAPISGEYAESMIRSLKVAAALTPGRGRPGADLPALGDLVSRLSWLANDFGDRLADVDINPVLVDTSSGRTCAVDALAILAPSDDAPARRSSEREV
nr:acetate--CoA ligase family protein [Antricoccus suffuscus]